MKLLILLSLVALAFAVRFDGDQVLTLYPKTPAHLRLIEEFESYNTLADFWSPDNAASVRIGGAVDIRFKSQNLYVIKKKLTNAKLQFDVKIADIQTLVENQFKKAHKGTKTTRDNYTHYHDYEEINNWTKEVAAAFSSIATREVMITSEEGRDIPMLTLSTNSANQIVLIDCGIHAREWISPCVCQYFVDEMVENYGIDARITALLDQLTFVVVPVLNVDGYSYSWTNDRMWRKTRSNYGTACTGVDPNRNFDAGWSGEGASSNPCSETYYGPVVESEQLTKGLSNFIRSNRGKIEAYLTFHSYAQVMLWPYSYDYKDVDNKDEHNTVALDAVAALRAVHGKRYDTGAGWDIFYLAAGGSDDMAKDNDIPLSYTIELRDTGRYGFILPPDQIIPTCEETMPLIYSVAEHVSNKV